MSTAAMPPMYGWDSIPWKKLHQSVWKLQKRIYQASFEGNFIANNDVWPTLLGSPVRMTNVNRLRSRMRGNSHVRF